MRFLARKGNVRSLGLWTAVLTLIALVSVGCIIIDEHDEDLDEGDGYADDGSDPPPTTDPLTVTIDPDAVVEAEPGEGVGMFVEYTTGGQWRIWTSCDTNYSGVACAFDAFVSVDTESELRAVEGEDLEGFDEASTYDEATAYFHADTDSGHDGFVFETTPGAIVRLDMTLDGYSEPRFVYWFGDGVLHQGAPTNPVDFQPAAP